MPFVPVMCLKKVDSSKPDKTRKQHPSACKQHADFTESYPDTLDSRHSNHGRNLETQPGQKKRKDGSGSDGGCSAEEQPHTRRHHEEPAGDRQHFSSGLKCRDGLPAICKVSIDGRERAESNHSDGEERYRRLLFSNHFNSFVESF